MENLHVLIFGGKYYVGTPSSDKKVLMKEVVELTPVFRTEDGNIHHVPCYLGDLLPIKSAEWIISKLDPKSALHMGYIDIMNTLQAPTDEPEGLNAIGQ